MRSNLWRVLPGLLALSLVGCKDGSGPAVDQNLVDLVLAFCSDEAPDFVAFQNEGGAWTRATPDVEGRFTISATEKLGVALVQQFGASAFIGEVVYVTRAELSPFDGTQCEGEFGTKTLNGTVSDLSGSQSALITMGASAAFAFAGSTAYSLTALPDQPLDLVASRITGFASDRVIIRRAVNLADNASIPLVDFDAAEAVALASNILTPTPDTPSDFRGISMEFRTAAGTTHSLSTGFGSGGTYTLSGIPASLTQAGDVHEIDYASESPDGTVRRGVVQFHRNPGDRTAALGAVVNTPTITTVATTPSLRMRAQLQSQQDYGSIAQVVFAQGSFGERIFVITMSSGYNGSTPSTWDLQIPDLSGVAGFPAEVGFTNGSPTEWLIQTAGAASTIFLGARGTDGTIAKYGARQSSSDFYRQASAASRECGDAAQRRSNIQMLFWSRPLSLSSSTARRRWPASINSCR